MLHRHQEVSFQLQDLRTSTESVGFSCISSSLLKPHSEDPGSVPFSGKFCSSRQGFHAHRSSHNQHKPRIFLQISEALQFFLQTCKEQNTYFQGAKYNSLWRPFWSPSARSRAHLPWWQSTTFSRNLSSSSVCPAWLNVSSWVVSVAQSPRSALT